MSSPHYITPLRLTSAQGQICCSLEGRLSCCGVLLWSAHVSSASLLCSTSLPLSLARCPSFTSPHLAAVLTLAGSSMTVHQEPRHQHNGTPLGSTLWDNTSHNVSWPLTLTLLCLGLDTIIAALPTVKLCMIEGE